MLLGFPFWTKVLRLGTVNTFPILEITAVDIDTNLKEIRRLVGDGDMSASPALYAGL